VSFLQIPASPSRLGRRPALEDRETWAVEPKVALNSPGRSLLAIGFASEQPLETSPVQSPPRASDCVAPVVALAASTRAIAPPCPRH